MKISVITINLNNKVGLENTIKSVISQKDIDFEYIVIDGNSNDGSQDILDKYQIRLTYSISEGDSGIYEAMNKGIKNSCGDYLLFLNSGDILFSDSVLFRASECFKGDIDIYYGNLLLHRKDGFKKEDKYPDEISLDFLYHKSLPHPATFVNRNLFGKVSLYNEDLKFVADWEFFMLAILKHSASLEYLGFTISIFDLDGMSNNLENKQVMNMEREIVMQTHFPLLEDYVKNSERLKGTKNNNRFTILTELEQSKIAQKLNSIWLRLLLFVLSGKTLKNLK